MDTDVDIALSPATHAIRLVHGFLILARQFLLASLLVPCRQVVLDADDGLADLILGRVAAQALGIAVVVALDGIAHGAFHRVICRF